MWWRARRRLPEAALAWSQGHQVSVVDAHQGALPAGGAVEAVASTNPDLVGVHLVYDWSDGAHLQRLMADMRAAMGKAPIVLYGVYPTFGYGNLLQTMPGVTAAVLGEPELTLVDVAAVAGVRSPESLGAVPGLALRHNGAVVRTASRPPLADLDALPFPHRSPEMLSLREVNIAGSRGCYGACTFCSINPFYGPRSAWRPRSPGRVIDEILIGLESGSDATLARLNKRTSVAQNRRALQVLRATGWNQTSGSSCLSRTVPCPTSG